MFFSTRIIRRFAVLLFFAGIIQFHCDPSFDRARLSHLAPESRLQKIESHQAHTTEKELAEYEGRDDFDEESARRVSMLLLASAERVTPSPSQAPFYIGDLIAWKSYLSDVARRLSLLPVDHQQRQTFLKLLKLSRRAIASLEQMIPWNEKQTFQALYRSSEFINTLILDYLSPDDPMVRRQLAEDLRHLGRFDPQMYQKSKEILLSLERDLAKLRGEGVKAEKRSVKISLAYVSLEEARRQIGVLIRGLKAGAREDIRDRYNEIRQFLFIEAIERLRPLIQGFEELQKGARRAGREVSQAEKNDIPRAYVGMALAHLRLMDLYWFLESGLGREATLKFNASALALQYFFEALHNCLKGLRLDTENPHTRIAMKNALEKIERFGRFLMTRSIPYSGLGRILSELSEIRSLLSKNAGLLKKLYSPRVFSEVDETLKWLEERLNRELALWNSIPSAFRKAVFLTQHDRLITDNVKEIQDAISYVGMREIEASLGLDEEPVRKAWEEWCEKYPFDEKELRVLKAYLEYEKTPNWMESTIVYANLLDETLTREKVELILRSEKFEQLGIHTQEAQVKKKPPSRPQKIYNKIEIESFQKADRSRIELVRLATKNLKSWLTSFKSERPLGFPKRWDMEKLEEKLKEVSSRFENFDKTAKQLRDEKANNKSNLLQSLTQLRSTPMTEGGYLEGLIELEEVIQEIRSGVVSERVKGLVKVRLGLVNELKSLSSVWETDMPEAVSVALEYVATLCQGIMDERNRELYLDYTSFIEASETLDVYRTRVEKFNENLRNFAPLRQRLSQLRERLRRLEDSRGLGDTEGRYTSLVDQCQQRLQASQEGLNLLIQASWDETTDEELFAKLNLAFASVEESLDEIIRLRDEITRVRVESCRESVNRCLFAMQQINRWIINRLQNLSLPNEELEKSFAQLEEERHTLKVTSLDPQLYRDRVKNFSQEAGALLTLGDKVLTDRYKKASDTIDEYLERYCTEKGITGKAKAVVKQIIIATGTVLIGVNKEDIKIALGIDSIEALKAEFNKLYPQVMEEMGYVQLMDSKLKVLHFEGSEMVVPRENEDHFFVPRSILLILSSALDALLKNASNGGPIFSLFDRTNPAVSLKVREEIKRQRAKLGEQDILKVIDRELRILKKMFESCDIEDSQSSSSSGLALERAL